MTNTFNASKVASDMRRYRRASFKFGTSTYDVTGSVREGFTLWRVSPSDYRDKLEIVNTFSSLDELYNFVEGQ